MLVQLPLGSYTRNPRPGPGSVWQVFRRQYARLRSIVEAKIGRRYEGVAESPEAPPGYLQVAVKGRWRAAGPEAEKVLVIVVYENEERRQEDQTLGEH
jgi:hypothetical protein